MSKIIAGLITGLAFLVALYLVLRGRPAPRAARTGPGARFALLVGSFVLLLGGRGRADDKALTARAEWKAVRESWHGVPKIEQAGYDDIQKVVAARRAANRAQLDRLVKARLVERDAAEVLDAIYGDRIYHHLRQRAATCYDPTQLGERVQTTRTQLESRLGLLQKHRGKLDPKVAAKVERALQKKMELLLEVDALWRKQRGGNWKAHRAEEARILSLFVKQADHSKAEITDSIKIRPGVAGAMRLIRLMYR